MKNRRNQLTKFPKTAASFERGPRTSVPYTKGQKESSQHPIRKPNLKHVLGRILLISQIPTLQLLKKIHRES